MKPSPINAHSPTPRPSRDQSWLTFLCWIMPGIALIGGVAFGIEIAARLPGRFSWLPPILFLGIPFVATIGCGIFASIVAITREEGRNWITPKKIFWKTFGFCCYQLVLSPFVASTIALVCRAVAGTPP